MARYIGILPSESRSTFTTSPIFINFEKNDALHCVVDITDGSDLLVRIHGRDAASGKNYTLLTSSYLASGTTVLRVGPAYTAATNVAKDYMPSEFWVGTTASGATTYSIGASLI